MSVHDETWDKPMAPIAHDIPDPEQPAGSRENPLRFGHVQEGDWFLPKGCAYVLQYACSCEKAAPSMFRAGLVTGIDHPPKYEGFTFEEPHKSDLNAAKQSLETERDMEREIGKAKDDVITALKAQVANLEAQNKLLFGVVRDRSDAISIENRTLRAVIRSAVSRGVMPIETDPELDRLETKKAICAARQVEAKDTETTDPFNKLPDVTKKKIQ